MNRPFRVLMSILLVMYPAPLFSAVSQKKTVPSVQEKQEISQDKEEPPSTFIEDALAIDKIALSTVVVGSPSPPPPTPRPSKAPQYISASPAKVSDSGAIIVGYTNAQCLVYAREVTGNTKISGYAGNVVPEGSEPKIGSIAVFKYYGHVGVVVGITGDEITVRDSNWVKGAITEHTLPLSQFKGFVY